MCISMATAALIGGGVSAAAGIYEAEQARKSASRSRREREAAEAKAAQSASARIAMQRRAMRNNGLFTGAGSAGSEPGTTATGRTTLGV